MRPGSYEGAPAEIAGGPLDDPTFAIPPSGAFVRAVDASGRPVSGELSVVRLHYGGEPPSDVGGGP